MFEGNKAFGAFLASAILSFICLVATCIHDARIVEVRTLVGETPSWCPSCNGAGEVVVVTHRLEGDDLCAVEKAEPCCVCKGRGVATNVLATRRKLDLPGVTLVEKPRPITWSTVPLRVSQGEPLVSNGPRCSEGSVTLVPGRPFTLGTTLGTEPPK